MAQDNGSSPVHARPPSALLTILLAAPLALTTVACALWYFRPQLGPLPLVLALPPLLLSFILLLRRRTVPLRALVTPYALPLLLFLVTAMAARWSAYDPMPAEHKWWLIVGAVLFFYALAHYNLATQALQAANYTPKALTLFGVIVSLYFVATHDWNAVPAQFELLTGLGLRVQALLPAMDVSDTLNPNVTGGLLAFTVPFTVQALLSRRPDGSRAALMFIFLLPALLFTLFALLLTSSLGAWVALAGVAFLAALWWPTRAIAGRLWQSPRPLYLGLLLIPLLFVLALLLIFPQQTLDALNALFNRLPGPGHANRLQIYRNALILVMDYPIIGAGLDGFMMLYSSYSYLLHVGFISHAHNFYLDLAMEQGLPGLLLFLALVALALPAIYRSLDPQDARNRPLATTAALALLIILVHGLVDDIFYGSRAVFLLFSPFALLLPPVATGQSSPPTPAGHRRQAPISNLHSLIPIFILSSIFVQSNLPLPSSFYYANLAAIQQHKAELSLYSFPEYGLQDEVRREIDLSEPMANYRRALEMDPDNASANRRLGQILLSLGQYAEARELLLRAYRATPWDNATRQLLGEAHIVNGYLVEGAALWTTVNNQQNQLQARVAWYNRIGDQTRHTYIRQIAAIAANH